MRSGYPRLPPCADGLRPSAASLERRSLAQAGRDGAPRARVRRPARGRAFRTPRRPPRREGAAQTRQSAGRSARQQRGVGGDGSTTPVATAVRSRGPSGPAATTRIPWRLSRGALRAEQVHGGGDASRARARRPRRPASSTLRPAGREHAHARPGGRCPSALSRPTCDGPPRLEVEVRDAHAARAGSAAWPRVSKQVGALAGHGRRGGFPPGRAHRPVEEQDQGVEARARHPRGGSCSTTLVALAGGDPAARRASPALRQRARPRRPGARRSRRPRSAGRPRPRGTSASGLLARPVTSKRAMAACERPARRQGEEEQDREKEPALLASQPGTKVTPAVTKSSGSLPPCFLFEAKTRMLAARFASFSTGGNSHTPSGWTPSGRCWCAGAGTGRRWPGRSTRGS